MRRIFAVFVLLLLVTHVSAVEDKLDPVLRASISSDEKIPVIVLLGNETSSTSIASYRPEYTYSIIPGFSAELSKREIIELERNPNVKRIYSVRNYQIASTSIAMSTSVDAIGARNVWQSLNITGRNITVAVIDTGIDYMHSDLGGCIGTGCRVKAGYNFYDNNNDSNDTHGHGTHVAGIVGANGSVMGVAPDVDFFALRVCNPGGSSCPDSAIIAAVDYAMKNGADIISMSLAGPEQPNDPNGVLEIVLDHAVERGLVVSVAAGNAGPGTQTTQSPSLASKVITVGNLDHKGTPNVGDDTINSGSCRGPSAFGRLDPDLVAPGTSIVSLQRGGTVWTMTGTSMATPHVSGAAALLLEYNSSLTPTQIRSLLMHTSENVSGHLFEKGAGLINVTKSMLTTIEATLNNDDRWEFSVLPGMNETTNLTIYNNGNSTLLFNFSIETITDLEGISSINTSYFSLPTPEVIGSYNSTTIKLNFSAPEDANASIYGTTLVITTNDSQSLRAPIVITIPLVSDGSILYTVNNGGQSNGDWIYHQLKNFNGTSLTVTLNWSNSANDLDLYLFAPNGEEANVSGQDNTESEYLTLSTLSYDTYWVAVNAYSIVGTLEYNLTIGYTSNITVQPSSWQGYLGSNENNVTFTITNDNTQKNISVDVKREIANGNATWNFNGSIPKATSETSYNCTSKRFRAGMNLSINETRFVTLNLTWNTTNNLDLNITAWNGSELASTVYLSQHDNSHLQEYWEKIEMADILYYIDKYTDVGVTVCNKDTSSNFTGNFSVFVQLYNVSHWEPATLSPSLDLAANETKNVTVTFNVSALMENEPYSADFVIENFVTVPLRITVDRTQPTSPALVSLNETLNNDTPTFQWNSSYDASGIGYYQLQVSTNSNFSDVSNLTENTGYNVNASQTNYTGSYLLDDIYFWKARAVDNTGNTGNFSPVENFTIKTIFINEFSPQDDWVEIYNLGSKNYTLNWTIGSGTKNYTINETINANGYLLLNFSQTNITLGDDNDTVAIWNPNGLLMDNYSYVNAAPNSSIGRRQDGVGDWITYDLTQSTPGVANAITAEIPLLLGWNLISVPLTIV